MITPTIPPAMLEAATRIAFEIRGFSVRQLERAPSIYHRTWEECNRQAIAILEVAGIAKLQAAADALPGLVAALEAVCALRLEETLTCAKGSPIDRALKGARKALAAAKGGAQ